MSGSRVASSSSWCSGASRAPRRAVRPARHRGKRISDRRSGRCRRRRCGGGLRGSRASGGLSDQIWRQIARECGEHQDVLPDCVEVPGESAALSAMLSTMRSSWACRVGAGLVVDRVQQRLHAAPPGLVRRPTSGLAAQWVRRWGRGLAGQGRADRVDQAAVGVGGRRAAGPGQAAGAVRSRKTPEPVGAVHGRGHPAAPLSPTVPWRHGAPCSAAAPERLDLLCVARPLAASPRPCDVDRLVVPRVCTSRSNRGLTRAGTRSRPRRSAGHSHTTSVDATSPPSGQRRDPTLAILGRFSSRSCGGRLSSRRPRSSTMPWYTKGPDATGAGRSNRQDAPVDGVNAAAVGCREREVPVRVRPPRRHGANASANAHG